MSAYPEYGTHPIKCGKRKCNWTGLETELKQVPHKTLGLNATQSTCPQCGCDNYSFLPDRAAKKWLEARATSSIPETA